MKILGIESSCDETAAAVVEDGRTVKSNIIASSLEEHKLYGGVTYYRSFARTGVHRQAGGVCGKPA